MSEHAPKSNESVTHSAELEQLAEERLENLKASPERTEEDPSKRAEAAREVISKHEAAPEPQARAAEQPSNVSTRFDHLFNYSETMSSMQRHLTPASRSFSRIIHTPVIEKASEVVGGTVMRPSVTLGASSTALIVGGFFYFTAKHYGFKLSGSELLISLIIGGLLGGFIEAVIRSTRRFIKP